MMEGLGSSQLTDSLYLQEARTRRGTQKTADLKNRDLTNMSDKDVRGIAQEFEAFFLSQVFEYMTKGLKTDGVFGGGHAEGIYRSMMNEHYGKAVAERGGYGVGDLIYRDILRLQKAQIEAQKEGERMASGQAKTAAEGVAAYQALESSSRHPSVESSSSVLSPSAASPLTQGKGEHHGS
jgi:Rod binding domain-containing protein